MALMSIQEATMIKNSLCDFINRVSQGNSNNAETAILPDITSTVLTYFCDEGFLPNLAE